MPRPGIDPCYSEELLYELDEIRLPPLLPAGRTYIMDGLGTSYTPALEAIYHNKRQCNSNTGTYTFSLGHLDMGFTNRAPYTIDYKVDSTIATTQTLTHYNGLVTLTGNKIPGDNNVDFYVRITDNKGCTFPPNATNAASTWYNARVVLPATTLSLFSISTNPVGGNYNHVFKVLGGIAPLTLPGLGTILANQTYTVTNNSLVYVNTVTDANGCTLNIIG